MYSSLSEIEAKVSSGLLRYRYSEWWRWRRRWWWCRNLNRKSLQEYTIYRIVFLVENPYIWEKAETRFIVCAMRFLHPFKYDDGFGSSSSTLTLSLSLSHFHFHLNRQTSVLQTLVTYLPTSPYPHQMVTASANGGWSRIPSNLPLSSLPPER